MTETTTTSIETAFAAARAEGRAALMPYLMGGFPDQQTATAVAEAYTDAGADLIELGVPFSDPLADGPTIHAADTAALAAGATLDSVLETCAAVGARLPVVLMVYANMVLAADPVEFAEKANMPVSPQTWFAWAKLCSISVLFVAALWACPWISVIRESPFDFAAMTSSSTSLGSCSPAIPINCLSVLMSALRSPFLPTTP